LVSPRKVNGKSVWVGVQADEEPSRRMCAQYLLDPATGHSRGCSGRPGPFLPCWERIHRSQPGNDSVCSRLPNDLTGRARVTHIAQVRAKRKAVPSWHWRSSCRQHYITSIFCSRRRQHQSSQQHKAGLHHTGTENQCYDAGTYRHPHDRLQMPRLQQRAARGTAPQLRKRAVP
jgi:hypothetical protein